jgi:response regulator NasT
MARRNSTEPEAFRMLQKQSQDRRIPMDKLAEMIVQADELLERPPGSGTRPRDVEPRTPQNLQGER